jgi:zona occludens toxin (predicted ATPase)
MRRHQSVNVQSVNVLLTWDTASDRLITSKDHASVQISIVDVDAEGKALPTSTSFALSGQVRAMGESDDSINRLATKAGCKSLYHQP